MDDAPRIDRGRDCSARAAIEPGAQSENGSRRRSATGWKT